MNDPTCPKNFPGTVPRKMSHNFLIFGLIGMRLCSCIPISNRHVVKFKESENVEKKVAKFV